MSLLTTILTHPANRSVRVKALARSIWWQVAYRLGVRYQDISFHGLRLRCYPGDHSASRALYFSGMPDYWEMRFMQDYLRQGDCFIDVGANTGIYTLLARSLVGDQGEVNSFEPNAMSADRLEENLRLNHIDNVAVHRVGVADEMGSLAFEHSGDDCTAHVAYDDQGENPQRIKTVTLDDVLEDKPHAMAKLDIEGYEPFAIRGMRRLLSTHNPPVMQIEVAGYSKLFGISTERFIGELHELGYGIAIYHPTTKSLEFVERHWEIPVDNILAVAKARLTEVEARLQH